MSTTADKTETEVRILLKDTNSADPVVDADTVRQGINQGQLIVSHELGLGSLWSSGIITTNTTDYDFTLPSTVEYHQVMELVYASDRWPLERISRDEVLMARAGVASGSGRNYSYALDIGPAQVVTVMFPMKCNVAEAIDGLVSTMPVNWDSGGSPPTVPFSRSGQRALELLAASNVGRALGPDVMTALDLNKSTFDAWQANGMELIRQERLSIIRLKRAWGPRSYRWFSDWRLT